MSTKKIEKIMEDIKKIVRFKKVDGVRPIDPEYMAIMVDVRLDEILTKLNKEGV